MHRIDILKDAAFFIHDPETWTRGSFARADKGQPVPPTDMHATCFCAIGALKRACPLQGNEYDHAVMELETTLNIRGSQARGLAAYNDRPSTTHADIVSLFTETIERVKNDLATQAAP